MNTCHINEITAHNWNAIQLIARVCKGKFLILVQIKSKIATISAIKFQRLKVTTTHSFKYHLIRFTCSYYSSIKQQLVRLKKQSILVPSTHVPFSHVIYLIKQPIFQVKNHFIIALYCWTCIQRGDHCGDLFCLLFQVFFKTWSLDIPANLVLVFSLWIVWQLVLKRLRTVVLEKQIWICIALTLVIT